MTNLALGIINHHFVDNNASDDNLSGLRTVKRGNDVSDAVLISELKKKDGRSYEVLYDKYAAAILGIVLKTVQQRDTAEDILLKVFQKAYHTIDHYKPENGRIFTWLVSIAKDLSMEHKLHASDQVPVSNPADKPEVSLLQVPLNEDVRPESDANSEWLTALPADQKRLIDLMYFKGYSQNQISKESAISSAPLETRLRAALCSLRKVFCNADIDNK